MNKEIAQAIIELKQAEQNFKYAVPEFVDVATLQLIAAEMKVDILIIQRKQNGPSRMDPWVRGLTLTKQFNNIVPQQEHTVKREIQVQLVNCMNKATKQLMAVGKNF